MTLNISDILKDIREVSRMTSNSFEDVTSNMINERMIEMTQLKQEIVLLKIIQRRDINV